MRTSTSADIRNTRTSTRSKMNKNKNATPNSLELSREDSIGNKLSKRID